MIENKKILVTGAGGFIGGHLVKELIKGNNQIIAADIKPLPYWFQLHESCKNYSLDLKNKDSCFELTNGIDYVFNMACNMGGMGFIENNKAECMLSVLINTHLLEACVKNKIKKYFFSSSACVYNAKKQNKYFIEGLKEEDAYPAEPEDGYGWEKLFSERMCRHFNEDFGLDVRIARYHNIYGPLGTFDGGREKAPAALCRKIALAKINNNFEIDVWGDGEQTRTFLFIEDCIKGTLKLFNSNYTNPLNIGSDEQVSINQMIKIIQDISKVPRLKKNYQLNMPKGVKGRSSNNELAVKILDWNYSKKLKDGLETTYKWIFEQLTSKKSNTEKFQRSNYL